MFAQTSCRRKFCWFPNAVFNTFLHLRRDKLEEKSRSAVSDIGRRINWRLKRQRNLSGWHRRCMSSPRWIPSNQGWRVQWCFNKFNTFRVLWDFSKRVGFPFLILFDVKQCWQMYANVTFVRISPFSSKFHLVWERFHWSQITDLKKLVNKNIYSWFFFFFCQLWLNFPFSRIYLLRIQPENNF